MILNALCLLVGPKIDVRVLEENSLFGIKQTCTITRKIGEDGSVIWEEKSVDSKDVYWVHLFQYDQNGKFYNQRDETVSGDKVSLFNVGVEEGKIVARMDKYLGEKQNSSLTFKGEATKFDDLSRLWWVNIKPEIGAKVNSMTYLQMLGFYDVTIEYVKDETIYVGGKNYDVHKIERKIDTMRNETWWVDDSGLIVKRTFWTRDENDPHRVDTIKG